MNPESEPHFEQLLKTKISDAVILREIRPVTEAALNSHIEAKDRRLWLPEVLVPPNVLEDPPELPEYVRSAIYVNALTEDNLPHYTSQIDSIYGEADLGWVGRWTAEEDRHGTGITRYIEHTSAIDLKLMSEARFDQLRSAIVPHPKNVAEMVIYTAAQEELTRIAHMRVGRELGKLSIAGGSKLFTEIAGDEALHRNFYTAQSIAVRHEFPDEFALGLRGQIRRFKMPGTGIRGFEEHSELISNHGIFTIADVGKTIVGLFGEKYWSVDTLGDDVKSEEAKKAAHTMQLMGKAYKRMADSYHGADPNFITRVSWNGNVPVLKEAA